MKDTWFFWLVFFIKVTILTKFQIVHLVKKDKFFKWSTKMPMVESNQPYLMVMLSQINHINLVS
jgi:hypothetical protein